MFDSLRGLKSAPSNAPNPMAAIGAIGQVIASLQNLPPAPVIIGAFSRMVSDAIAKEMIARGPSPSFRSRCAELGYGEPQTIEWLYEALVAEMQSK